MDKPRTRTVSLPPQDQVTAAVLRKFGFEEGTWKWVRDDIPDMLNQIGQIRGQKEVVQVSKIDEYSLAYKADEDAMPAVVVTSAGSEGSPRKLVDGRHRVLGVLKAKTSTKQPLLITQFVLNVDPDLMDPVTEHQLLLMGLALNQKNGTRMTLRDIAAVLAVAIPDQDNISSSSLAALLGISPSTILRTWNLRDEEKRAAEAGISLEGVSDSALVILGQKKGKISSKIHKEIVTLIQQAGLSTNEMKILFKEIEQNYDDVDRMGTLRRWNRENADRISGTAARPTGARRLMLALGQLEGLDVDSMIERSPQLFASNLTRLEKGYYKLEEAIKRQKDMANSRGPSTPPFSQG